MTLGVGEQIPVRTVTVSREGMKPMAIILRDPNPIHWDLDVLRELGLDERPVNHGPTNLAYVWDALTAWTGSAAAVKRVSVRFVSHALADEELTAGGMVTSVGDGTATCDVWLQHADGTPVVRGTAVVEAS
jgi:acyl dehydratase